jgi:hypothetical protein
MRLRQLAQLVKTVTSNKGIGVRIMNLRDKVKLDRENLKEKLGTKLQE